MNGHDTYRQLRHLTLPVVAVTTSANGRRNGFIVNSAQRASLVPDRPRISLYVSKTNESHDLVHASGIIAIHLLRNDQYELIEALGMNSAREVSDKLAPYAVESGETGCPILKDVLTAFECRVTNAMDAGGSTFFLADVTAVHDGTLDGDVMTSTHFRAHAPAPILQKYEARLQYAQEMLAALADVDPALSWTGPTAGP